MRRLKVGGNRANSRQGFALVDDEDYERLSRFAWSLCEKRNTTVAIRKEPLPGGGYRTTTMHREIVGLEHGDRRVVDHRDGNGLHNCKVNLRVCTGAENAQNRSRGTHSRVSAKTGKKQRTSQYRGVVFAPGPPGKQHRYPWMASLRFPTEQEAAEWRQQWEREYMPFADPNH